MLSRMHKVHELICSDFLYLIGMIEEEIIYKDVIGLSFW